MRIPKSIEMSPLDMGALKWSSIFFGMLLGAYYPKFTRRYAWLFEIAVILLAIKPIVAFFRRLHDTEDSCEC